MITPEAFASLVHRMRRAQRQYFNVNPGMRTGAALAGARRLERDVDRALEEILPPPITRSPLPGRSSSSHDQETPDA